MGKLTSTIGIPIKLLNEAQVRVFDIYFFCLSFGVRFIALRKSKLTTLGALAGTCRYVGDHDRRGLSRKAA
jgi:hypothetical protein